MGARFRSILFGLLLVLGAAQAQAASIHVVNAGADFKDFLKNFDNSTFEQRLQDWDAFEKKYKDVYQGIVFDTGRPDWQERRTVKLRKFFDQLPNYKAEILDLFDRADRWTSVQLSKFIKTFPDLGDDVPVVLVPSLFSFNGKAATIPSLGKAGLILGLDMIVARQDDLDVLFAHEMFHAYHMSKIKFDNWLTLGAHLWAEGMAVYASGLINPDRKDDVLLMDAELAKSCAMKYFVQDLAGSFPDVMAIEEGQASFSGVMNDWFLLSGPTNPKRRAYCLGLQAMRYLATQYRLETMITWDQPKFTEELKKAFSVMAPKQEPLP